MTIARPLSLFAVSLTLAALSALLGPGDAQARIKCNSILGPGGTYVLNRDLTCLSPKGVWPNYPDPDGVAVLTLIGGATLNLNGHTVTCKPGDAGSFGNTGSFGIVARDSTVKNGTVRGCGAGVIASRSLVKGMTLDGNAVGVMLRDKHGSGNNLIVGNTAMNNRYGFFIYETRGETLIDNVAQNNWVGFDVESSAAVLIGNVALRNETVGFRTQGSGPGRHEDGATRLIGNRAAQNGAGFLMIQGGEMTGNIAKNNSGVGFVVESTRLDLVHDNVARGNGDDGFQLPSPAGTLSGNHAINNLGHGLHVVDDMGLAKTATITGNMAIRNGAGDLADDTDCRVAQWVDNRFGTAAQPCIH